MPDSSNSPGSPEDALALSRKAEALVAEGDEAVGMPLLLSALDMDPCCFEALENLGIVAIESPAWSDELHRRLAVAMLGAKDEERYRFALWLSITHAAFHGRVEIVRKALGDPARLIGGNAHAQAAIGALLCEIGDEERGMRLLQQAETSLSQFHLGRLWLERGEPEPARRHFETIGDKRLDGILREAGFLLLELPKPEAAAEAKRLAARAERSEDALGPHVASEILLLKLRAALALGQKDDANWAAEQLGMPAHEHDPGAMLRAARLLGPLPSLKG